MNSLQLLIAGLLATRNSPVDKFTAGVAVNGVQPPDLKTFADKWALESWTEYDEEAGKEALSSLLSADHVAGSGGTHNLTEGGRTALLSVVKDHLRTPKRLSQFTVALAFSGLLDKGEVEDCVREFHKNLVEAIRGNTEKLEGLKGSPFEHVTSLCLAQMKATQSWLEQNFKI